jgi:hypothetical protein
MASVRSQLQDPRLFQIATLSCLLAYGAARLDFEIRAWVVLAIIVTALGVEWVLAALSRSKSFELRSALISTLSKEEQAKLGEASELIERISGARLT